MIVRWWPQHGAYELVWQAMRDFTQARDPSTPDELWLLEHAPVYTLGQAGQAQHILNPGTIPVVQCDRGGQVTYHGPGQLMVYCLIDLRRHGLFVKEYVALLEDVLIALLAHYGLAAYRLSGAPGVYVPRDTVVSNQAACAARPALSPRMLQAHELAKIAALGVKVSRGCAYHGLALNVDMDLRPFEGINPCGYAGMHTTDLRHCGVHQSIEDVGQALASRLSAALDQRDMRLPEAHA